MSALRDLATQIRTINQQSPEIQSLQSARTYIQWLKQRAIRAIQEDDAIAISNAKYRTGGPALPCVVFMIMTAPDPDEYMFALPTGLLATMVVDALNAQTP